MDDIDAALNELRGTPAAPKAPKQMELYERDEIDAALDELRGTPQPPANVGGIPVPVRKPKARDVARDQLSLNLDKAAEMPIAERAKRESWAKALGVPVQLLPEDAEAQVMKRQANLDSLVNDFPEVTRYLNKGDNAAMGGRNIENLTAIRKAMYRVAVDPMVDVAKGAASVPEAIVGLADLFSKGKAGKKVEEAGISFKDFQGKLSSLQSPELKAAKTELQKTEGFFETLGVVAENPSLAASAVVESVPLMLTGSAVAQTIRRQFPKVSALIAGAAGEATVIAGSQAEKVRQQTADGELSWEQVGIVAGSSVVAGGVGVLGAKISQRLGFGDLDTALASGKLSDALGKSNVPKPLALKILAGAAGEGGEEMTQTAVETVAENVALGKVWDDGLESAMAMGLVTGSAMGGGAQALAATAGAEPEVPGAVDRELDTQAANAIKELSRAVNASESHRTLSELVKVATDDPMRKDAPEAFKDFVRTMADEDDAITDVYVKADLLEQTLQQAGVDLGKDMPNLAQDIRVAKAGQGDVRIAIEDFATHIVGAGVAEQLLPHARVEPEGMTQLESEKFYQEQLTEFAKQAEEIVTRNQPILSRGEFTDQGLTGSYEDYLKAHSNRVDAFAKDAQEVHDKILAGMNAAKRFNRTVNEVYAIPFREFYSVNAAREGIMPSELFARLPLNFAKMQIEGLQGYQQFAGQRSATADLSKLDQAKALKDEGTNNETIRRKTGWFVGDDGKWRYEINDSDAKWKIDGGLNFNAVMEGARARTGNAAVTVGDLLDHPALFGAYPGLADVQVGNITKGRGAMSFTKDGVSVAVNGSLTPKEALSTMLHEIQHFIQSVEDFGRGGSVDEIANNITRYATPEMFDYAETLPAFPRDGSDAEQDAFVLKYLMNALGSPMSVYSKLAGEVEARNTQARQDLTPELREMMAPFMTADVPSRDVIVMFNGQKVRGILPETRYEDATPELDIAARNSASLSAVLATEDDLLKENVEGLMARSGWAVLTAANPNSTTQTDEANAAANEKLKAELDSKGLKYEAVYGMYSEEGVEIESFMVYGISQADAHALGNAYGQESILTREGLVFNDGKVAPARKVSQFDNTEDAAKSGYTRVPRTDTIFTFDIEFNKRAQQGAITVIGTHYSGAHRPVLEGKYYGTGLPGEEKYRVQEAADPRVKTRVDFYADTGSGVRPESGLGSVVHKVMLHNIYNGSKNPLRLPFPQNWLGANVFEQAVLDAGYDGYYVDQAGQGRVVVLGSAAEQINVTGEFDGQGASGVLQESAGADRGTREADGSLRGLPRQVGSFNASHYQKAEEVTRRYMAAAGLEYNPPSTYVKVDEARAKRIAQAYDDMPHAPQDPEVKAAYDALVAETTAQYQAVLDSGLVVEFIDFEKTGDPYAGNPRAMTDDVRDNNHMYVFSTRDGFGSSDFDPADNPLLGETEFTISGQKALVNDLFRVVHDYFGHVKEGVGFRAAGEENAWRAHMSMFSPLAGRALTTETRGQNSWVNFGPFAEHNKTASGADTHYADQKIGLLPEWVSTEGAGDPAQDAGVLNQSAFYSALTREVTGLYKLADKNQQINVDQAKAWINSRQKEGKFKKDEVEAVGVLDWLDTLTGKVNVAEIELFVQQNGVQLEEDILSDSGEDVELTEYERDAVIEAAYTDFLEDFEVDDDDEFKGPVQDVAEKMLADHDDELWRNLVGSSDPDEISEWLEEKGVSDAEELANELTAKLGYSEILGDDVYYEIRDAAERYEWELRGDDYVARTEERMRAEGVVEGASANFHKEYTLAGEDSEGYAELLLRLPDNKTGSFKGVSAHYGGMSDIAATARVSEYTYRPRSQALRDYFKAHDEWRAGNSAPEIRALLDAKNDSGTRLFRLAAGRVITPELQEQEPELKAEVENNQALADEVRALQIERKAVEPKKPEGLTGAAERVLFIEEIQSDWAQQGRDRGFEQPLNAEEKELQALNGISFKSDLTEEQVARQQELIDSGVGSSLRAKLEGAVPTAPFVTDTKAWTTLVVKRLMRYAAENGFDRIAWTTGAQQAARYDLAQAVGRLYVERKHDGMYEVSAVDKYGMRINAADKTMPESELPGLLGKELAQKIAAQPDGPQSYEGPDLKLGGEGMNEYYNRIVPSVVNDVAKKLGGGRTEVIHFDETGQELEDRISAQMSLPITQAMKDKIMQGLPLFQKARASFNPQTLTIALTQGSDFSSVIHEGGHFYLEALEDLASQPNAPQQVKDDFAKTLEWFGIKGVKPVTRAVPQLRGSALTSGEVVSTFTNAEDMKQHPDYAAGKAGDIAAAHRMVVDQVTPENLAEVAAKFKGAAFVPVALIDRDGANRIPSAMAYHYANAAEGSVADGIYETEKAFHTGMNAMERLISRANFAGEVVPGQRYVLVDDVTTMGSTLADLAAYIQSKGGIVEGSVLLTNATRSGKMLPTTKTVKRLEEQYGNEIRELFNIEPSALTFEEAQYLLGFRTADELRGSAAKAKSSRDARIHARNVSKGQAALTPEQVWAGLSLEEKRPYHEQWAQSFERYAMEGKSPSVEMQPVFTRFRRWLLDVYKSIQEFLKQNPLAGKLNDDVRGIFDRLIASEEAIAEAEKLRGYAPLFADAESAGVTAKQYEEYLNLGQRATSDAADELNARSIRDMKWLSNARGRALKALQAEARTKRKLMRAEVEREIAEEPVERARLLLAKGQFVDENGNTVAAPSAFKLNLAEVKALRPGLNLNQLRGMTDPDGISLDLAAQMFGFGSGEELILELIDGESTRSKVQARVDQRMLEENGDLADERAIEAAADEAVHNEARARFMATGLAMLSETKSDARQMVKAAKQAAENVIANKTVREIKPGQYSAAEARANKEALKKAASDRKGAAEAQRAALLNNKLFVAARDAKAEVDSIVKYVKKFEDKKLGKSVDYEYLEQINDLLQPFDFKNKSLRDIDKSKSLLDWVQEQEANGFQPAIDVSLVEDLKRKHYKDMTLDELRNLRDAIKQIEHLGRYKHKLLTAKDKREFQERIDEADASIRENANRTVEEQGTPTHTLGKIGQWFRQMTAAHRKFNSVMREMDGGKDNGAMWQLLSFGMNDAGNMETDMRQSAAKKMAELFKMIKLDQGFANLTAKKRLVPGTKLSMTHEQRIMFGMNWGNEGNRQRLLDGGITGQRAISLPEAQKVLDTLTKEEWDFIQATWDYIGSYRDQIAALERKMTGIEPTWIEPSPVETPHGAYRGGYFPAKYDTELSTRSESLEAVNDLRMGMKGAFQSSATRNGYTQERAAAVVNRPLLLSFNVVPQHVNEVIHRLSWQPWLTDANRVLKALDLPIREHYGADILRELRNTVQDIAVGDAPAKNAMESAINRVRVGSTIVGMGWKLSTALLQPTGLAQSYVRVGPKWVSKGLLQFMGNPNAAAEFADAKSSMMRNRGVTMQREINEVLNTLRAGETASKFQASYFVLIGKMQRAVDIPTWLGAYEKGLATVGYENAVDDKQREAMELQAVALADQAVLDSQSGGMVKDLAGIQRGSPIQKLFTNFYSYFSATYNLNVEAVRKTDFKSPTEVLVLANNLLLLNVVPVIFAVALKEATKGDCGDDLECLTDKLVQEQASFMLGQMVGLREISAGVGAAIGAEQYGYQGPAGLRFFSDLYKVGVQTRQGEFDMPFFKAVNNAAGAVLHYPAGQINATIEGIIAIEEGQVEGVSILPALLFGPPRD